MINAELFKKIRQLELRTKKMLRGSLSGDYRTKQKGFGLEFEQLAEYQFGDDIRFIDWKSSARMGKLLVKEYHEERNRTIMLIVDGSASNWYGSKEHLKHEQVAQVAGIISLAGLFQKDTVGLIIVTDEIECYIPPKSGRKHMHAILQALFSFEPKARRTNLSVGLKHLMKAKTRDTFCFLISDFIDTDFERELAIVARNHELVAIRCTDEYEKKLPFCGYVQLRDIETGLEIVVDTGDKRVQSYFAKQEKALEKLFNKCKTHLLSLSVDSRALDELRSFLIKRVEG